MSKKCEIKTCSDCPYMDNEYYTYERDCMKLDKILDSDICDIYTEIYEGCPLEDYEN